LARKYVLYKCLGVVQSELESAIEAPFITKCSGGNRAERLTAGTPRAVARENLQEVRKRGESVVK
jgi:hypothetical protein